MKNPTYISDGDEIAIREPDGRLYASVFVSVTQKRIGVRLEKCLSFGKPHVIWVDSKSASQFSDAFAEIADRLSDA